MRPRSAYGSEVARARDLRLPLAISELEVCDLIQELTSVSRRSRSRLLHSHPRFRLHRPPRPHHPRARDRAPRRVLHRYHHLPHPPIHYFRRPYHQAFQRHRAQNEHLVSGLQCVIWFNKLRVRQFQVYVVQDLCGESIKLSYIDRRDRSYLTLSTELPEHLARAASRLLARCFRLFFRSPSF